MPNRLIHETSPYLLQHAHNPVDWYPWGPEALRRAKEADMPILLSIGYSACHWCHVMERESFEDHRIAQLMNDLFVCIKVDREERPDIDSIYMTAVQTLTGHGGWPMTVFLTPDAKPFYGGTYFPPDDRGGMPAFPRVLQAIAQAYQEDRGDVIRATEQLLNRMEQAPAAVRSLDPLSKDVLYQAYRGLSSQFDDRYGGIGVQPKFPQPMVYEFLLRYYLRSSEGEALKMVELTLDRMALGGMYDQIGGGFHRYSTDMYWLVPHFEKMLYDNALLSRLYLHAYQITGKPLYRRAVEETLDYVIREMTDPSGGFYSAQDADSEGEEGKFFVWRPEQIIAVLGRDDGEIINAYFGVTLDGNFEGRSILNVPVDVATFAKERKTSGAEFNDLLVRSQAKLLEARNTRVHPGRDDKILTAWNALMLRSFAEAGAVFDRPDYVEIANQNANFLLEHLLSEGRLLRTYRDGKAKLNGYLEDYAFLIDALIALHEATLEPRWAQEAITLGRSMVDLFWDDTQGQFYDTGSDHEELIIRPRDITDNALPCGNSMAVDVLLRLSMIAGDGDLQQRATTGLRSMRELMTGFASGAGHWLCALDFYLSKPKEIAIIGDPVEHATRELLYEVYRHYIPNRVVLGRSDGQNELPGAPLLEGRQQIDGNPTAYVCENYVCQLPVNAPEALARLLAD